MVSREASVSHTIGDTIDIALDEIGIAEVNVSKPESQRGGRPWSNSWAARYMKELSFRDNMFSRKWNVEHLSFSSVRSKQRLVDCLQSTSIVEVACKRECRHDRYIEARMMF